MVDRLVYVLLLTSGCFSYDDIKENRKVVKLGGMLRRVVRPNLYRVS